MRKSFDRREKIAAKHPVPPKAAGAIKTKDNLIVNSFFEKN